MTELLSDTARRIFDALPADGSKLSGGKIKDRVRLQGLDYDKAKKELKALGLVELGKGRGGSMSRVDGVTLPPTEEVPEPTEEEADAEAMRLAREAKEEKRRWKKESDAMHNHVESIGWSKHPDADDIKAHPYDHQWYYEVWVKGAAHTEFVEDEELL